MNNLVRITYGRSGSRLGRVIVSGRHDQSVVDPPWLKLLLLTIWITIPALVSLYAIPTARQPISTVIDLSRLKENKPVLPEIPALPKRKPEPRVIPIKPIPKIKIAQLQPTIQKTPLQPAQRPLERRTVAPPQEARPSISRPAAKAAEVTDYQPRIVRERLQVTSERGADSPSVTRARPKSAATEPYAETPVIRRTRGAAAVDAPVAEGGVAARRLSRSAGESAEGAAAEIGPIKRKARSSGSTEGLAPTVAQNTRPQATRAARGEAPPVSGLVRGVSLASLDICSSTREEEDHISKVLKVVGSRQACTDDKGEFRLRGTQRISSFNLMIFPANGRRPSNRCEELENVYKCLKTH